MTAMPWRLCFLMVAALILLALEHLLALQKLYARQADGSIAIDLVTD